ncbi:uncharacterized protein LOC108038305 [Drosophila rhopaloa]|nr:uncharacterized protein LOC108038305 [Drosophila rhopaloa]
MQSNKILYLFFGVLAVVIAASLSAEAVNEVNDVISDRRFRWEFSEDSDESDDDLQDDDDNGDQDGSDGKSGEFETWQIEDYIPESNETKKSASNEP